MRLWSKRWLVMTERQFDPAKDTYPLPEVESYPEGGTPLSVQYTLNVHGVTRAASEKAVLQALKRAGDYIC